MTKTHPQTTVFSVLRSEIKADAIGIRVAKEQLRALQRADDPEAPARQSALARRRLTARARLLLYGRLRGRRFDEIEPGHPAGEARVIREAEEVLRRLWRHHFAVAGIEAERGALPVPGDRPAA